MKLLSYLGPALVGALLTYLALPSDPVVYTDVVVPAPRIIEREPPDRPPTIVERVVYRNIPPAQVATALGGATDDVARFCRPTVLATTDTVEVLVADPMLLIRAGVHSPAPLWRPLARDQLLLTGPTSEGDLRALDFPVRPGWDFRASGDSVLVRYPRTTVVRELVETGALIYTAIDVVGRLIGGDR